MSLIIVETTCASEKEASDLAKTLVEMKLAACCHVFPNVRSFFFWDGRLEEGRESVLRIKTLPTLKQTVCDFLLEKHSYSVPECVCVTCEASSTYQAWMDHELH